MDSASDNSKAPDSSYSPTETQDESPRTPLSPNHPHVNRTERGLVVRGTRLTLYDIWERRLNGRSDATIAEWYRLTPEQVADAFEFIQENQEVFAAEYAKVLRDAEALRLYYEERNRPMLEKIAAMPPPPGKEAQFAMLQERKRRLGMK